MPELRSVKPDELTDNVFRLLDHDWMLVTAGTMKSFNTMTASWGGFGILWGKRVGMCVIRPGRHTYGFIEKEPRYTFSFFEEKYRPALDLCGSVSGRDRDKVRESGLTPVASPGGSVYFAQARLVLELRKLYTHDFDPKRFVDPKLDENYPQKDYHRMYLGEIEACLLR